MSVDIDHTRTFATMLLVVLSQMSKNEAHTQGCTDGRLFAVLSHLALVVTSP